MSRATTDVADQSRSWPCVSVVIPARNEEDYIEECVQAFLEQDYPAERLEIIVADGRSDDRTRGILEHLSQEYPDRVRWVDNPGRILASGANAGIRAARGEYVLRFDAHAKPSAGYVQRLVEVAEETGAGVVGGTIRAEGRSTWQKAIALAQSSPFGVGGARTRYARRGIHRVKCMTYGLYRRSLFDKVGLYDEEFVANQDLELAERIAQAGLETLLVGDVQCAYFARRSVGALAKQQFRVGWWVAHTLCRGGARSLLLHHLVPGIFVAAVAVLAALSPLHPWVRGMAAAVLGAYVLAHLVFAVRIAWEHGLANGLRVPLAFATMHVSYGIGTWCGLASVGVDALRSVLWAGRRRQSG